MRTTAERKKHLLELLTTGKRDVWVATADTQCHPHLVPLSLGWDGENVVVATETGSLTARNLNATNVARLAVGDTRDVNLIDATVSSIGIDELDPTVAKDFATRNDWDPRNSGEAWAWFIMKPVRVLAWENEAELEGRTIMKQSQWLA